MSKNTKQHEVVVTYKKKRGRPSGIDPMIAWQIVLDGEHVGYATTLNSVSSILYDMGYKTWAFRRCPDKKDRPRYKATVLWFDKEKES